MSQNVYVHKYTGAVTGWPKKLEIIPGGATELTAPVYFDLPPACVVVKGIDECGYDKYSWGLPSGPALKVFIDINLIPKTADYNDLRTAILNPAIDLTGIFFSDGFSGGTIYKWYIDFKGNQYFEEGYREVFRGIQLEGIDGDYNLDTDINTITIEAEDAVYYSLRTAYFLAGMFALLYLSNPGVKRQVLYEYLFKTGGVNYAMSHYLKDSAAAVYFQSKQAIWDLMEAMATEIHKLILRDSTAVLTIDKPLTQYYAADLLGLGRLTGSALSWSDIWEIADINKFATLVLSDDANGLLATKGDMRLSSHYTCFWDYLADFYKESLTKCSLILGRVWALPMFENTTIRELSRGQMFRFKPKISSNELIVRKITSSMVETVEKDIDKAEAVSNNTRNKGDEPIPIIHNNTPVACKYDEAYLYGAWEDPPFNIVWPNRVKWDREDKLRIGGLYQMLAAVDSGGILTNTMPVKLSEFCRTYLGQGKDTDDLPGCAQVEFNIAGDVINMEWFLSLPTELCLKAQGLTCKPKIHADAMCEMLKNKNLSSFEADFQYNSDLWIPDTGPYSWWLWFPEHKAYQFDLSALNPELAYLPILWFSVKKKLDDEKEISTLTFMNNPL